MTNLDLKPGDKIQIDWFDGLTNLCTFLKAERGFIVFTDSSGKKGACNPLHAKITQIKGYEK